ncbi:hypothetical protein P7K49_020570, partial [Saguinus oedipus]
MNGQQQGRATAGVTPSAGAKVNHVFDQKAGRLTRLRGSLEPQPNRARLPQVPPPSAQQEAALSADCSRSVPAPQLCRCSAHAPAGLPAKSNIAISWLHLVLQAWKAPQKEG